MAKQPYHKYVFDEENRKFVGKFEKMYANEDKEHYDSWFQDDLTHLSTQLSLFLINRDSYASILDIGCGKGAVTNLLKKDNNQVVGVDISRTAIQKAQSRYKHIEFMTLNANETLDLDEKWDLIVMREILSYLENWREILAKASERTSYIHISLYLPPDPIGFVKSFTELKDTINKFFNIELELIWNDETIFILGKRKNEKS